jgi:hypothetical protein
MLQLYCSPASSLGRGLRGGGTPFGEDLSRLRTGHLIAQSAADVWHMEINPESDRLLGSANEIRMLSE